MSDERGRPLIVGESPSKAGDRYHSFPLSGAPAKFICDVAGLEVDDDDRARGVFYWSMVQHFDTANSVERWPGKSWPTDAARERVAKLVEPYDVVVLMGRKAQVAYGKIIVVRAPFFSWVEDPFVESTRPRQVVAIPHSSGLNRAYNDPAARESAGRVLREAIERARIAARV